MLKCAEINCRIHNSDTKTSEDKVLKVSEAQKIFNDYRKTGKNKLEVYTYNLLEKKFKWQTPFHFDNIPSGGKIIGLELKVDSDNVYKCMVDSTCKGMIVCNRVPTQFNISQLQNTSLSAMQMTMGYIADKDKIEYKEVKRVYDWDEENSKKEEDKAKSLRMDERNKDNPSKTKRGRPKKVEEVKIPVLSPEDRQVVKIDYNDGAFTVYDRIIIK